MTNETKIGEVMAGTGMLAALVTSVGAGLTSALTDNQSLESIAQNTAIVTTLASMPITFIGEKLSAENASDELRVGLGITTTAIYSPICYGIGYGIGNLIKYAT